MEKYNKDFLSNFKIQKQNKEFIPHYHIQPIQGLLNDPNCIFYYKEKLYCFFQHHPVSPIHGLKTMSLATTNNFADYKYNLMVNKPENEFENAGIYSGSALVNKGQINLLYTGNKLDENYVRTSSIVFANFDYKNKKIINKKVIINNLSFFEQYTEHFRDPFVFEKNNKKYFLLGAQTIELNGTILLFELSKDFSQAKLIKNFNISKNIYRMIECPNVFFDKQKACLIFCPQKKVIDKKDNPDLCFYSVIDLKEFFNNKITMLKKIKIVDYGLNFYAPQIFKIKNNYNLIAWIGLPTIDNNPENKDNWINCLSSIRQIKLVNDELIQSEKKEFINKLKKSNFKNIKYFFKKIAINESIILQDKEYQYLKISKNNKQIIIYMNDIYKYYPYQLIKKIQNLNEESKVEIFLDNSVIEIKIDNSIWYSSRIYFKDKVFFK